MPIVQKFNVFKVKTIKVTNHRLKLYRFKKKKSNDFGKIFPSRIQNHIFLRIRILNTDCTVGGGWVAGRGVHPVVQPLPRTRQGNIFIILLILSGKPQ